MCSTAMLDAQPCALPTQRAQAPARAQQGSSWQSPLLPNLIITDIAVDLHTAGNTGFGMLSAIGLHCMQSFDTLMSH